MFEMVLNTIVRIAAAHLIIGVILLIPFHIRALPAINASCAGSGLFFRCLITPGLITFWPFIVIAWKRKLRSLPTHGPVESSISHGTIRQGHRIIWLLAIAVAIGFVVLIVGRHDGAVLHTYASTDTIIRGDRVVAHMDSGRIFPSLPANVQLVSRDSGYLLRFDFDRDRSVPPSGLYWAPALSANGQLPTSAVLLGILEERQVQWVPLPNAETLQSGFWMVYSFADDTMESFTVPPFPTE